MPAKHLLILGGTLEARDLASRLAISMPGKLRVTTSLAGRLARRPDLPGDVRTGGFGGIPGMTAYLRENAVDLVIDATHPFSPIISDHANAASAAAGIRRLQILRPPWPLPPKAEWIEVADLDDAATVLSRFARRVFLTTGARGLDAFAPLADLWFLIRMIEPPTEPPPLAHHVIVTGMPPYSLDEERKLLAEHDIDTLVSKNAGGHATAAKITAAAEAGVKIVLLRRPPPEPGPTAETVDEAIHWIETQL